jgi:hypothetical protein
MQANGLIVIEERCSCGASITITLEAKGDTSVMSEEVEGWRKLHRYCKLNAA